MRCPMDMPDAESMSLLPRSPYKPRPSSPAARSYRAGQIRRRVSKEAGHRVKMSRMNESQGGMVVSSETLNRWEQELKELTSYGRAAMSERLQRAREFGDIRANADYDAARDKQAMMEARIRHLQHMIKNPVV